MSQNCARVWYGRLMVLLVALSLVGCTTRLAPLYDAAVVTGLHTANTEAMTLLVTASAGTQPETFSSREDKYNTLVGRLEALLILAKARPVPRSKISDTINKLLIQRGSTAVTEDDAVLPSVQAITKMAETLLKMRDTDRKQGVTATEVQAFRRQLVVYLDQAITYEHFLQR